MLVAVSKPCGKKKTQKQKQKQKKQKTTNIRSSRCPVGPWVSCMHASSAAAAAGSEVLWQEREREREMLKADSSVEALKSSSKQSITHHRAKITLLGRSKEGILV